MYEIKKINANSLAKYSSLIGAGLVFIFGVVNVILNYLGWGYNLNFSFLQKMINLGVNILFFYVLLWLTGYLTALIYNLIAKKSKGLIVQFNLIDMSLLEDKEDSSCSEKKNFSENERTEKDLTDKFVV